MNKKHLLFTQLVSPNLSSLKNTALRMTRRRSDAEDLLQETLYKAYRSLDQFKPETNFRAWIFRILVNSYITSYRKITRQPQKISFNDLEAYPLHRQQYYLSQFLAEPFPEKDPGFVFNDDIQTALNNLPHIFRLVVLLCDVEGFSYNEIAQMIGCPIGTVMSRLYRGRKLLQRQLWHYAHKHGYITETTRIKK